MKEIEAALSQPRGKLGRNRSVHVHYRRSNGPGGGAGPSGASVAEREEDHLLSLDLLVLVEQVEASRR